jgi:hypothetical protein
LGLGKEFHDPLIRCHAALLEIQIEDRLSGRAPACLP